MSRAPRGDAPAAEATTPTRTPTHVTTTSVTTTRAATAVTPSPGTEAVAATAAVVRRGRRRRSRARRTALTTLGLLVLALVAVSLMVGQRFYGPGEVLAVILGEHVPGASFTVGELRLPRACLALLAGGAFGLAGVSFQTMLRNPLASPDVIGISAGAGAAAVLGIVVLHLDQTQTSLLAVAGGLGTALLIHLLAADDGVAGIRLVLIGIGIAAMLQAVITWVLARAAAWDVATAMQWLTGSVNGASWTRVVPLAVVVLALAPVLLAQGTRLELLRFGDDSAAALGVDVRSARLVVVLVAVTLLAVATAAAGPISFVAFLSGPLAARLVRPGGSMLLPGAIVGAGLVLGADLLAQFAFDTRYPVGVVTGAIGAPALVLLLVRSHRTGGSL